jgi:glyceraldehyde 3-phosphate dehydrogenase
MSLKVAINGTGRIGLCAARIIAERSNIELVGMNTTTDIDTLVHLMRFDSVHKSFKVEKVDDSTISIGNSKNIKIFSDRDPSKVAFGSAGAKVVLECTGVFRSSEQASAHLHDGVEKVVISAPASDDTPTFVMGVNSDSYAGQSIVSNASCTTNCLAPVAKVLNDSFGIESGLMTTVHSYTNDQNILDVKHKDIRRARAAAMNMIPTSTGAAKAIGLVLPELQGKMGGFAIRVPTPDVSVVDLSVTLTKSVSKDSINEAMLEASKGALKDLLEVDVYKRVSSDFIGSAFSAIFVPDFTNVVGEKNAKVLAWYDNEWGYSNRLVDLATHIGR